MKKRIVASNLAELCVQKTVTFHKEDLLNKKFES